MTIRYSTRCPNQFNFAAYLTGTATGHATRWIEHHLTGCECCFDIFVTVFNQYLDQSLARKDEERREDKSRLLPALLFEETRHFSRKPPVQL